MISFPQGIDALVPFGLVFLLITARIGGLFIVAPIFSAQAVSPKIRVAVMLVVSFSMMASLPEATSPSSDITNVIIAIIGEITVGAAAGLSARMVVAAIETAGQLLGTPMGLGFANAVDPQTGANQVITTHFLSLIAMMILLALDIHLVLISMMAQSFQVLPPGYAAPSMVSSHTLLKDAALIFDGAVRLSAPVMIVLLGVMATVGLLARVAQKMNLLVLSFAISVGLGLITLRAVLPDMVAWMRGAILRIEPLTARVLDGFVQG